MKMHFITFRSVTPAQWAQRLLQKAGILSSLQRTPRHMQDRGCGYCLRLRAGDTLAALQLLKDSNIGYSKVYTLEKGAAEELAL